MARTKTKTKTKTAVETDAKTRHRFHLPKVEHPGRVIMAVLLAVLMVLSVALPLLYALL